jgi:hypothetical protein
MPMEVATAIALVGGFATAVGAAVSLFNSRKAVRWKRAELANNLIREFNSNDEMVFAGRCLDWQGGRLALPEKLRAYLPDNAPIIQHDRKIFAKALRPDLMLEEDDDPRIQIYRTSIDSFLSWLSLVASGLNRKLFVVEDIEEVGYWVAKIQSEPVLHGFISAFGYEENILKLIKAFRGQRNPYRFWHFLPPDFIRALVRSRPREAPKSKTPQSAQAGRTSVRPPSSEV